PPPLLSKLKADLKTAMRAKDAPRLSVLRNILAATTNAAKTSSPIRTDGQLIALMRKTARGNHEAREEALKASRQDLVEKEEAQIRVIDEYVAGTGVKVVEEEELRGIVEGVVREAKAGGKKQGEVMKELLGKNWDDEGKYVDKAVLSKIAKE
ncbi:GatB/YqeY domain-containing protein, partial [Cryphonectria parasitica EP155]